MTKIFTIEGIDGSGKQTITELVGNKLSKSLDQIVASFSFPEYETNTGKSVRDYLSGKFNISEKDLTDPYFASLFYILNRAEYFRTVISELESCKITTRDAIMRNEGPDIVISDRYFMSNIIHQGSKIYQQLSSRTNQDKFIQELTSFIDWITDCEFNKVGNPMPVRNYVLDISHDVAYGRIKERFNKHGAKTDIHENIEHLRYSHEIIGVVKSLNLVPNTVYLSDIDDKSPEEIADVIVDDIIKIMSIKEGV